MAADPFIPPLPNSYWVLPGELLAGEYPQPGKIREYLDQGIDCFIDLTQPQELEPYEQRLPAQVEYFRKSILDHGIPARREQMAEILALLCSRLDAGRRVYLHCRAGIGRTGTVVGCLLVEQGLIGDKALDQLNRLWQQCTRSRSWPYVPETEEQIEFVRSWQSQGSGRSLASLVSIPRKSSDAEPPAVGEREARERFRGALLGLAVGDALAVATQGQRLDAFDPVSDLEGGGPDNLPRGAWTDDTAMALCLTDSLLECHGFDARDQVARYHRWQQSGYLSATGRCIGITASTARALSAAQWRRQVFAGSHDPKQLDSEVLSRVAPAVMFAFASPAEALRLACEAARPTCQAPAALDACRLFAALLHGALAGKAKEELFSPELLDLRELRPQVAQLLDRQSLKEMPRRSPANVLAALGAALHAFRNTANFQEGALQVVNLGGHSDAATAAYGQLAGAWYGAQNIPAAWRKALLQAETITAYADRLFQHAG